MKLLTCALIVLALGCDATVEPVSSPVLPESDVLAKMDDRPTQSGIRVFVHEGRATVILVDAKTGLVSVHGRTGYEVCLGVGVPDVGYFKDVIPPDPDGFRIMHSPGQAEDVRTEVWPIDIECEDILDDGVPIASGLSDGINTDNDILPWASSTPNRNVWSWRYHGKLDLAVGGLTPYTGQFHCLYDFEEGETSCFDIIRLPR